MKLFILLSIAILLNATDEFGIILKLKGIVKLTKPNGTELLLKKNDKVYIGDTIFSDRNSKAIIQFGKSIIALNRDCKLVLEANDIVIQKKGTTFYNINPTKALTKSLKRKFLVKTRTATMGIRGTNFIVENNETDENICLRKGVIDVTSLKDEFKLYIKKHEAEWKKYKKDMQKEFEKFKGNSVYSYAGEKKTIELKSGGMISLNHDNAFHEHYGDKVKGMFDEIDSFLELDKETKDSLSGIVEPINIPEESLKNKNNMEEKSQLKKSHKAIEKDDSEDVYNELENEKEYLKSKTHKSNSELLKELEDF